MSNALGLEGSTIDDMNCFYTEELLCRQRGDLIAEDDPREQKISADLTLCIMLFSAGFFTPVEHYIEIANAHYFPDSKKNVFNELFNDAMERDRDMWNGNEDAD